MATRASAHSVGAAVLKGLVASQGDHPASIDCGSCGKQALFHDHRSKQLLTAVGLIEYTRPYYFCSVCHQGQSPRDRELDVEGTTYSPAVRRMLATVGSESSFDRGREQMELLAGLEVTTKAVERQAEAIGEDIAKRDKAKIGDVLQLRLPLVMGPPITKMYIEMDGMHVPIVKADCIGREGKIAGQPARTREVKLGCVFTQTICDPNGWPIRDESSTTYVGAIETAAEFGARLYTEVWERGWSRAILKIVLGDGAIWIWNLAGQHFPGAIQIVDLYHARQHIWGLAAKLFSGNDKLRKRWAKRLINKLNKGRIPSLVSEIRSFPTSDADLSKGLQTEAEYFEHNKDRMQYPKFRALGLFVGSGVIEAGCKTVIGSRLKQSGMFWTVRGANSIIALRCNRFSSKFEDYWDNRSMAA